MRLSAAAHGVRKSVFAELQGRIDAFRARGGELIPLQIGDTHRDPPPEALAALAATDARELTLYGAVPGLDELRAAIAERASPRLGSVGPEQVLLGCGCTHALFCAARALLDPGDEVLVASPYWPLIPGLLRSCGAVPIEVPLSWPLYQDRSFDLCAALDNACSAKTRALYLITPGNPDGQVYLRAELQRLAEFAQARDLWVLADEVYADFVYDGEHASIAALDGMAARTVSSYSLSKSHGLAGARIGWVVGPEPAIAAARRIANHTVYNVPVPLQRAALAAIRAGAAWQTDARNEQRAARDRAVVALNKLGLTVAPPRGGSFVFVDLAPVLRGQPLYALLELAVDEGVLLAPGDAFGEHWGSFARLCFTGVTPPLLDEGIARLGRAIARLS